VCDPIQPGAQVANLGAALERLPGADETRLQNVLGQRRGERPAEVPAQRTSIALDDRFEGAIVPLRSELREASVALAHQHGGHP